MRLPRVLGVAVVSLALLSGCGKSADDICAERRTPEDQSQQVDDPTLAAAKEGTRLPDCPSPAEADPVAGGLPNVTLGCLGGGGEVDLAALRGPMVVNLWASWCKPCREELPIFERFHQRYGDQVAMLGIDYQDPQLPGAMRLAGETKVSYPNVGDPDGLINGCGGIGAVRGLPTTLMIDETGEVVWNQAVEIESLDQLTGLVEDELGVGL